MTYHLILNKPNGARVPVKEEKYMSEKVKFKLNRDINRFFTKGTIITIVDDWGDSLYISNGLHRVNAYPHELNPVIDQIKEISITKDKK